MGRKRTKGTKYCRVTKQQKYIFLKLCISQKQSIHEAAFNSGIHYSTAKTILFFHKKQYKNYTTYIVKDPNVKSSAETAIQATYRQVAINVDQVQQNKPKIQLIVNSKSKLISKHHGKRRNKNVCAGWNSDEENIIKFEERSLQNKQGESDFAGLKQEDQEQSSDILRMQSPIIAKIC